MRKSNVSDRPGKSAKAAADLPPKPYKDFPLSPHALGRWVKRIKGKHHYFGHWGKRVNGKMVRLPGDGWREALEKYKAVADDLHAGRTPRTHGDGLRVADLCNLFLTNKTNKVESGELGARMFAEYKATCVRLVNVFGGNQLVHELKAADFEFLRVGLAKAFGPVRLGNEIQKVKTVFKFALDHDLIQIPIRFGSDFRKPNASVMRRHRATSGQKLFEAHEIQALLDNVGSLQLRAMILLGINCGFGNSDCGKLPQSALDLAGGWVTFPRPKTGIARRCPLWPETVDAIRTAMAERAEPKNEALAGLVFLTRFGGSWAQVSSDSPVTKEMTKLLDALGLHRRGLGFYSLRHTFRTIADAARDVPATRLIMGHTDSSIDATYRERIDDVRLVGVTDHVRNWLWPATADKPTTSKPAKATASPKRKSADKAPSPAPRESTVAQSEPWRLRIVG